MLHGTAKITSLVRRWRFRPLGDSILDPVTLSRGAVLRRLGPGRNKHGAAVELIEVVVDKPKEHHKTGDHVIWELPPKGALARFSGTYPEKLRAWLISMEKQS